VADFQFENAIAMLEKNYGGFCKIFEQLMKEVRLQKQVKDSSDFQEFSNLVENLAVTVENVGKKSHFTSSIVNRKLLKKLPEYLQWGQHMVQIRSDDVDIQQFAAWVNEQNNVISKVEIGNEARPTEVKNGERNENCYSREVSNNKKTCPICRFVDQSDENHRLCFWCLLNHGKGNCLSKKPCCVNVCTRNHHQMLHIDEKQSGSTHNTNVPASQVISRVVPVMNRFNICDEASTTTLIDASFAEKIGADGPELPFCCR
jgi:hypothetical protein